MFSLILYQIKHLRYFAVHTIGEISGIDIFDYCNWILNMGDDNVY